MRIAILGAGSLGTIIGALITSGGREVDLIDTNQKHVQALNESGATITGSIQRQVPVKAVLPSELTGQYDLVFLLTKQLYTRSALEGMLRHLHADSIVCTLQNGVPEERVSAIVGKHRTIGGAVGFGATWIAPGVSELTSTKETLEKYAFEIGELDGSRSERLIRVKQILDLVGHCEISTNLAGFRWTKLLMNTTFSGMSTALGCTFGDVLYNEAAMRYLAMIADETIKTAHRQGIRLVTMQGHDMELLELQDESDIPSKIPLYMEIWGQHTKSKASMLQDLEKGIRTEVDYLNGAVCDKGRQHGVKTPINDIIVRLVKEAEQAKQLPDFTVNLERLQQWSSR